MGPFGQFRYLEDRAEFMALQKLNSALVPGVKTRFVFLTKRVDAWIDGRNNRRGEVKYVVFSGYFVPGYKPFEVKVRVRRSGEHYFVGPARLISRARN